MEKIVFTLNNTGIHHDYCSMAFVTFELLLTQTTQSGVRNFMKSIGFTEEEFNRLNKRIALDKDTQVAMNETHLIIFYSVIHFACMAFVDEKERNLLASLNNRQLINDMLILREKLLEFGTVVSQKLRREYPNLKKFNKVTELISID